MTVCICYHDPCPDGLSAAWVLKEYFKNEDIEYYPIKYGMPTPDFTGKDVYVVDFSFSVDDTKKIELTANSLTVLDHHVTALDNFKGYQCLCHGTKLKFDMNHSGAMLAWLNFFPEKEPPWWIKHIEDADLWTWKYQDSRGFSMKLNSRPLTFESLDYLNSFTDSEKSKWIESGNAWREYHLAVVTDISQKAQPLSIDGITGYQVNCPWQFRNDVGHQLSLKNNTFGFVWDIVDHKIKVSLRSTGFDVEEIAKKFNGGGHKSAAAFSLPLSQLGSILGGQLNSYYNHTHLEP